MLIVIDEETLYIIHQLDTKSALEIFRLINFRSNNLYKECCIQLIAYIQVDVYTAIPLLYTEFKEPMLKSTHNHSREQVDNVLHLFFFPAKTFFPFFRWFGIQWEKKFLAYCIHIARCIHTRPTSKRGSAD